MFLYGMEIQEAPEYPRYTLPKELLPGIPWPPGFREEFNDWSVRFLGTTCLVPRGAAYVIYGRTAIMRKEDIAKISNLGC